MTKDHTEVEVASLPDCNFGTDPHVASYDGKTVMGPWAYMCEAHWDDFGIGLGLGVGQRLIVRN